MPIPFTCPFCGAQTGVADRYAGQTGPCARCGQQITVPGAPGVGPDAYTGGPPPARSSSSGWAVAAIVVGVLFAMLFCGGILTALLLPAVQASREAARRMQCTNNMKQILLALRSYEEAYGQFPPAYVADKDGKPLYSWRVLILPYMESNDLYDQFHLDKAWDDPDNQAITRRAMSFFHCLSNPPGNLTKTDYVMVVGPNCVSDGLAGTAARDFSDGMSRTVMLVEIANSEINWAEPRDLDFATMSFQINDQSGKKCISSNHPGVANVGMADGSVHALQDSTDPTILRQLIQINDNAPDPSALFD